MTAFEWFGNLFQSLTVLGVVVFILSYIAFLFTAAIYLLRKGEDRYAWFMVGMVALFLGGGLSYGMAKSVELLAKGVRDSLQYVPDIQQSVNDAYNLGVSNWQDGTTNNDPNVTITEGDVTIVATPGWPGGAQPTAPAPTSTPESPIATPDDNAGGGGPAATLTNEQAATNIAIQQQTATFTPRPPISTPTNQPEPTYDPLTYNPMTPPPTVPHGG